MLFHSLIGYALIDRLVQEAMSGRFLDSNFSLPCPPGLDIPPEVISPFTSNNLKVNLYTTLNQQLVCSPCPPPSSTFVTHVSIGGLQTPLTGYSPPPSLLCALSQFLLLLGCFAFFWSLYYLLEVTLAHADLRVLHCLRRRWGERRARRGRGGRGARDSLLEEQYGEEEEHDSGVELHAVVESEAKEMLLNGEQLVT